MKVVLREIRENKMKQLVQIEKDKFVVYSNIREDMNKFDAYYFCDLCDKNKRKFVSKLIHIKGTGLKVCLHCLDTMQKAMKIASLDDYKNNMKGDD